MLFRIFSGNRRAYSVYRSGLALDRLNAVTTPEEKRQAAKWASAWYAGGRQHRRQRIGCIRVKFITD
jgi:hypothetical protein